MRGYLPQVAAMASAVPQIKLTKPPSLEVRQVKNVLTAQSTWRKKCKAMR